MFWCLLLVHVLLYECSNAYMYLIHSCPNWRDLPIPCPPGTFSEVENAISSTACMVCWTSRLYHNVYKYAYICSLVLIMVTLSLLGPRHVRLARQDTAAKILLIFLLPTISAHHPPQHQRQVRQCTSLYACSNIPIYIT